MSNMNYFLILCFVEQLLTKFPLKMLELTILPQFFLCEDTVKSHILSPTLPHMVNESDDAAI